MNAPALQQFLAEDFAGLDPALLQRCRKLDGQRLYLSGATGFFGKNLLALLADLRRRGTTFEVTALSRDPARLIAAQPWYGQQPWLTWVTGDARHSWPGAGQHDLLLHAATDTAASAHRDGMSLFDGIVAGGREAFAFAATHGVRRVLLCGSGAQYGRIGASGGVEESSAVACDPTLASSAHGEAKRVCELLGALHAERHGAAVINTRNFAFVGPGLALDGHFAIGNFLRDALARRHIELNSDGTGLRSYLYSADLAVWLLLLLLEAPNGTTVNVGSDHAISIVELARRVRDLVHPGGEVRTGAPAPGGERHYYVPALRRARELGLEVWTDLDRSILRTALWYGAA